MVHLDLRIGNSHTRNFQFKSCSGAVLKDVIEKQIPELNGNQQVILLSAGIVFSSGLLMEADIQPY